MNLAILQVNRLIIMASTIAWNNALFYHLQSVGIKVIAQLHVDDYYTSEFCERICDKINRLTDHDGMVSSFVGITLLYEDLMKEDSPIEFNGKLLSTELATQDTPCFEEEIDEQLEEDDTSFLGEFAHQITNPQ